VSPSVEDWSGVAAGSPLRPHQPVPGFGFFPEHAMYLEDILARIDMLLSIDQFNFGIESACPWAISLQALRPPKAGNGISRSCGAAA
jgi:hypothetical protein